MAGQGVKTGKDDTLYAIVDGTVQFKKIKYTNFNGNKKTKQVVSVNSLATKTPAPTEEEKTEVESVKE